jgi:hypothetical protein
LILLQVHILDVDAGTWTSFPFAPFSAASNGPYSYHAPRFGPLYLLKNINDRIEYIPLDLVTLVEENSVAFSSFVPEYPSVPDQPYYFSDNWATVTGDMPQFAHGDFLIHVRCYSPYYAVEMVRKERKLTRPCFFFGF